MGLFSKMKEAVGMPSEPPAPAPANATDSWESDDQMTPEEQQEQANEWLADFRRECAAQQQNYNIGKAYFDQVPAQGGLNFENYIRAAAGMTRIADPGQRQAHLAQYGQTTESMGPQMQYWNQVLMSGGQDVIEYNMFESQKAGFEAMQSRYRDHALFAWQCSMTGQVVEGEPPISLADMVRLRKNLIAPGTYTPEDVECLEHYWQVRIRSNWHESEQQEQLEESM